MAQRHRDRMPTFEVVLEANLRGKEEHQQMVNVVFVSGQEQNARLCRQLTHEVATFQL